LLQKRGPENIEIK